uniref:DUF4817 domain-containing protein n=1 Tax=Strigamia maritima TaxID=126957 RepID=T1IIM0_STRMM
MANYTTQELVDIVYCYAECGRIADKTARVNAQRFPARRHLNAPTVRRLILRFEATGSVQSQRGRRRQQPDGDADRAVTVLATVIANHITRQVQQATDIPYRTVRRILHQQRFHPYHLHCHQGLQGHMITNRGLTSAIGCTLMMTQHFLTGSCGQMKRDLVMTAVSISIMHTENPHWLQAVRHQHQWSINVRCGVYQNRIIGPLFYAGTLLMKSVID